MGGLELRRRMMMGMRSKGHNLPPEYQEVEYIYASGAYIQQFDSISAGQGIFPEIKFAWDGTFSRTYNANIYSAYRTSAPNPGFFTLVNYQDRKLWVGDDFGGIQHYYSEDITPRITNTVRYTPDGIFLNNEKISSHVSIANQNYNVIPLFTRHAGADINTGNINRNSLFVEVFHGSVYEFKRRDDDGNLVRLSAPCYRISDNKPGFYDTITNGFYIFTGSTPVVGPDIE